MTQINLPINSKTKHEINFTRKKKLSPFSCNDIHFLSKRFIRISCLAICLLITTIVVAQPGQLDLSFNSTDNGANIEQGADNDVRTIVVQPNEKIIIGGLFTNFSGTTANHITRINKNGTLDPGFNAGGSGANGNVYKVILQADGKIIVTGDFTAFNSSPANHIVRLNEDGTVDASFSYGSGFVGIVNAMAIQPDGKIIVGGTFTSYNAATANYLLRLNTDGTKDVSFIPDAIAVDSSVNDIALLANGNIIVAKNNEPNNVPKDYLVRLNTSGSNDATFHVEGTSISSSVNAISVQADGKILVAANGHYGIFGDGEVQLIRINSDGTPDNSFSNAASPYHVTSIQIQPDGKIIIGYGIPKTIFDGDYGQKISRLMSDGTVDSSFNFDFVRNFNENVFTIALQDDGKILVGESYIPFREPSAHDYVKGLIMEGSRNFKINSYNSDGSREQDFCFNHLQTGANRPVYTLLTQPDGKTIVGGSFFNYNGLTSNYLLRLNADGSRDESFNIGGIGPNSNVSTIALQQDGKILIGGVFSLYNTISVHSIARLNADGSIDPSFSFDGTGIDDFSAIRITKITVQPDGKILVGGYESFCLFRLNANGSKDIGFTTNFHQAAINLTNYYIDDIAVQPDGKIIAGGLFGNSGHLDLVRLNTNGSNDLAWNQNAAGSHAFGTAGPGGEVHTVILQADGKILIAGEFTGYSTNDNFIPENYIARLNTNGEIDPLFNTGAVNANDYIKTMLKQPDGKLLVSGNFTTYGGNPAIRFARLNSDATFDAVFNVGTGPGGPVFTNIINAIALQPDGKKIIAGGSFTSYNGVQRTRIARINNSSTSNTTNAAICASELPYEWNGINYNASGTYTFINGDVTDTLILTVGAGNVTGPDRVCSYISNGTNATYHIVVPAGSAITWSVSDTASMHIVVGQGTSEVSIKFLPAFVSGSVYAKVVNAACGINVKPSLSIKTTVPPAPGAIIPGSGTVCPFIGTTDPVTYKINKVAGATSYTWDAQAGTTNITHPNGPGINDTIINVVFSGNFTTSAITVQAINDCGLSNVRSFSVARSIPGLPASITGPLDVCPFVDPGTGADYSITTIAGLTYNWSVTGGAIITNTTVITGMITIHVNFPASFLTGNVSVTASNGCGTSAVRKVTVRVVKASIPGLIDVVNNSPCPNRIYTYSVSSFPDNATSILWTVPTGATIELGQGTISITVSYPPTQVSGHVSAQSFNNCSASSIRYKTVSLPGCSTPNPFARNSNVLENNFAELHFDKINVQVSPNPSLSDFRLLVSSAGNEPITIKVFEVQGRLIREMKINANQAIAFGSDLKAGTYIIEVRQGKYLSTKRILKL